MKSWRSHLESPFDIPTYRYIPNCCINSRFYEPTGIRLTTASQTLTAINVRVTGAPCVCHESKYTKMKLLKIIRDSRRHNQISDVDVLRGRF